MEESTRGVCAAVNRRGEIRAEDVSSTASSPPFLGCVGRWCVCVCNVHREREDQVALIFGGKGSVVGRRVDMWRRKPFIVEGEGGF